MKAKRMKQKEHKAKNKKNFGKRNINYNNTRRANSTYKINKLKIFKVILALLVIAIIIIGAFVIYNNLNEKSTDPLLGDKDVFGMKLTNISIEYQNGVYILNALLKNTLKEKFESKPVQIVFRDEANQKIVKYQYTIKDLEKGETQDIQIKTSEPINEFYTFDVKGVY